MKIENIFHSNIDNKITKVLKFSNNRWIIDKYFPKNIFFIVHKEKKFTKIINTGFCLDKGKNFKLTDNGYKMGILFENDSFTIIQKIYKEETELVNLSINFEYDFDIKDINNTTRGDWLNEMNLIDRLKDNNNIYLNNKPYSLLNNDNYINLSICRGNATLKDNITKPKYSFILPYDPNSDGIYCLTKSWMESMKNKKSLLYPHVYPYELYDEIQKKPKLLLEQKVDIKNYNFMTEEEVKELKLKYFPKDSFVVVLAGRIAINSYPSSLLHAIKRMRENGIDIYLLILGKLEVSPYRLSQYEYDELKSYDWVKSFTVPKKEVLNYYRIGDVLASTYRDYCNHVGGCNKIKEFLLCNRPIICSRGKERENELGKDYFYFYDCKTCNTVPPLNNTKEFIKNPDIMKKYYDKYFKVLDRNINKNEVYMIRGHLLSIITKRKIIAVIPIFGREPLLKYTIRRLYEKNNINYVIGIGYTEEEEGIVYNEGAIFLKHINKPLGRKWNAGFKYIEKFDPDAVLFVGSSDWISSDWIDKAYKYIEEGYGYVGKEGYSMVDITDGNIRYCLWHGYLCDRKYETIGIGRLISKKLLKIIKYKPFDNNKNKSMDYSMYLNCINNNMLVKIINNESIFLSVSCDLWINMHIFNYHYDAVTNNYNKYIKNKNVEFIDYIELYKNGDVYTKEEIKKLQNEFPEIIYMFNDYINIKKIYK